MNNINNENNEIVNEIEKIKQVNDVSNDNNKKLKDNKDNKNNKFKFLKNILILQAIILIYTLSTVAAKFASGEEFLSFNFILFYGIEIFILGIYAILWQQIIKKFEISVAYANRAMALLWSIVWALVFFNEKITIYNVIGVVIVIIGTIIVNSDDK